MHTTLNNTEKNAQIGNAKRNKSRKSINKSVQFEEINN